MYMNSYMPWPADGVGYERPYSAWHEGNTRTPSALTALSHELISLTLSHRPQHISSILLHTPRGCGRRERERECTWGQKMASYCLCPNSFTLAVSLWLATEGVFFSSHSDRARYSGQSQWAAEVLSPQGSQQSKAWEKMGRLKKYILTLEWWDIDAMVKLRGGHIVPDVTHSLHNSETWAAGKCDYCTERNEHSIKGALYSWAKLNASVK